MATQHPSLSSTQLKHVNDLTRLSVQPGNLDYDAYHRYLTALGHVKTPSFSVGSGLPAIPQTTALQNNSVDRSDNKTDFRADQALWSQDNLPEVIYIFDKPMTWMDRGSLKDPPLKTYNIYGTQLRDIPILPDHISSKVEGWRVEAWMRFDSRLSLMDIIDRMPPNLRPAQKSVIQMRSLRFRDDCKVLGWVALGKTYAPRKKEIVEEMENKGIDPSRNSTRGISWGLVDVSLGEAGGRIVIPQNRRVPDTVDMSNVPLASMQSAITTSAPDPSPARCDTESTNASLESRTQQNHPRQSLVDSTNNESSVKMNNTTEDSTAATAELHPNLFLNQAFLNQTIPDNNNTCNFNVQLPTPAATPPREPTPTPMPRSQRPEVEKYDLTPTIMYFGKPLTLKSPAERLRDRVHVEDLAKHWFPAGSLGRRVQLEYLLDPAKLRGGFVDNRGFHQPIGGEGCIEADIIYGCEHKLRK